MKKYIAATLILFFAFIVTPEQVKASSYNEETVFDYAGLLTAEEENALRDIARTYETYEISMVFLTISDAEGKSSMTYSDDFYDRNAFRPDGVLFLIDMANREVYVNTVGKCIRILTDYRIERILDVGYNSVADGRYFDCFRKMSSQAGNYIENYDASYEDSQAAESYKKNDSYESLEEENVLSKEASRVVYSIIIAGAATGGLIVILIHLHKKVNLQIPAGKYMSSDLQVNDKDVAYMGCRREVMHGYYRKNESSSAGRSTGSGSRSSSHTSSRGVSHGGGGRKF